MNINQEGIDLIKRFEGFRSKPYYCPANVVTIGFGTTIYPTGRKVAMKDKAITEAQAEVYLKHDCNKFENLVENMVTAKLNENQFSALVSFAYNCGAAALLKSTLLKKINANPNDESIRAEFMKWDRARVNGVLTPLDGLRKRREAEANLYFKKVI